MILVLVFRPELASTQPFDGYEVLGLFKTEKAAWKEIDKHDGNNWHFHIDTLRDDVVHV